MRAHDAPDVIQRAGRLWLSVVGDLTVSGLCATFTGNPCLVDGVLLLPDPAEGGWEHVRTTAATTPRATRPAATPAARRAPAPAGLAAGRSSPAPQDPADRRLGRHRRARRGRRRRPPGQGRRRTVGGGAGLRRRRRRLRGRGVRDAVGVDRLREHATPEDIRERGGEGSFDAFELDRGQAETLYDSASDCIDFRRVLVDSVRAEGLSGAQADCFEEALTEDLVGDFMLAVFAEGDESDEAAAAVRAIEEAAAPCENVR